MNTSFGARVKGQQRLSTLALVLALAWTAQADGNGISRPCQVSLDEQAHSQGSISPFSEGLVMVRVGGKDGYMDTTGKMIIEPQFESAGSFSEGLASVGA